MNRVLGLQLDVQVREPQSQIVMASATSYRPSLQRVAPAKMVEEVLNEAQELTEEMFDSPDGDRSSRSGEDGHPESQDE